MSSRDHWRKILDVEVARWSAVPSEELISALQDQSSYQAGECKVEMKVLEITEKYLHIAVAVGDGTAARPLSRSFFCKTT